MINLIKRVQLKQSETKHVHFEVANNKVIEHNEYTNIRSDILSNIQVGNNAYQRNGDKINLVGMKIKMYFENQQYRPFVNYRLVIFRDKFVSNSSLATGATDLWEGTSTSKNLDWLNTNRFEFKVIKNITVKAVNSGTSLAMGGTVNGVANIESTGESYEVIGNPSRYVDIWVPFKKTITFNDNGTDAMGNRYQIGIIGYSSYATTTSGATYPLGHVHAVAKLYWKDL